MEGYPMPISSDVPWKDLDTKGFVHVRGFLTPAQLEACRADYASLPAAGSSKSFDVPGAGPGVLGLKEPITEAATAVAMNTNIRVDCPAGANYFATKRGVTFNWHQDHESYFMLQSHANYLNFYIPVVKPRADKSNLSVVPFDALERKSPETYRWAAFSGATSVYPTPAGHLLVHDDSGDAHSTQLKFDDIAATPELSAGDLLLLRGDVFHKTQDTDTDRVSLSVRLAYTGTVVRRSKMADGGLRKAQTMVQNMHEFEMAFHAFDLAGKDEMSWGELRSLMDEARQRFRGGDSPLRSLLAQKLRSHVVLSSARRAAREIVNGLKYRYRSRQPKRDVGEDAVEENRKPVPGQ
jgi:hypothetical protein